MSKLTHSQFVAQRVKEDAIAAFFYVTNWWYVLHDQSYFEATGRPPMLQHLWSLAVEEQFYLVWPLVMIVLLKRGGDRLPRVALWLLGASVFVAIAGCTDLAYVQGTASATRWARRPTCCWPTCRCCSCRWAWA